MTDQPSEARFTRSRRWVLSRAAFAVGAIGAATVPAVLAVRRADAQTSVDMELAVIAAMVDPPKSGNEVFPDAGPSVEALEAALASEGHLGSDYVDGHFGSSTIDGYAAWQRSLGYSGLGANGLPGPTSLTKLGEAGDFTVDRKIDVGSSNESQGGKRVNGRTKAMLIAAEGKLGWDFTLSQGSYTTGNPDSAGTHDGGGVVDIAVASMSTTERWQTVEALRDVGFAAWLRTPEQGFDYHIHANAVADTDMSGSAQAQVHDYYFGKNGLASHAPDNTPSEYQGSFTWWEKVSRG